MPKGPGHIHKGIYPRGILPILHSHLDLHRRLVGIRHDLHHLGGILHPLVDLHHLNVGLLEERENSLHLHHRLVGIRHDLHHLRGIPHILHSPVDLHHLNASLLEEKGNSLCGGRGNLSGDGPFALSIESMNST
jgi:hypothetical protein